MSELLLRQVTQFDTDRTEATLATPTCSSCCCCCCCLGTTVGMSVVAMQDVKRLSSPSTRASAMVLAAAALPLTAAFWVTALFAGIPILSGGFVDSLLTLVVILLLPYFFLLLFAYQYARVKQPAGRIFALMGITGLAMIVEAIIGMMVLFGSGSEAGILFYLALAGFIAIILAKIGTALMRRLSAK